MSQPATSRTRSQALRNTARFILLVTLYASFSLLIDSHPALALFGCPLLIGTLGFYGFGGRVSIRAMLLMLVPLAPIVLQSVLPDWVRVSNLNLLHMFAIPILVVPLLQVVVKLWLSVYRVFAQGTSATPVER